MFQSTRPRGARPAMRQQHGEQQHVSIHAPAWGATRICSSAGPHRHSFNPRARVGRDDPIRTTQVPGCVSIHAPAWGATAGSGFRPAVPVVSIHAPAWGATGAISVFTRIRSSGFNPRARVGRDEASERKAEVRKVSIHAPAWGATRLDGHNAREAEVSIHAPAWGATVHVLNCLFFIEVSIHAPAWGATAARRHGCEGGVFQSTRPRGARPSSRSTPMVRASFNPRARVGRDFQFLPAIN
ncbi:Protein of uncharacterised function (DUF3264) [Stutzerimonas stutzeri]|nr:Protein of uncharacterised function (DUF3264) [Stutzerimonas stutzeri]